MTFWKSKKDSIGFTITEIMIVLSIAGVILAVVLSVVPQASRSQRNNTRKTLVQRLASSLENYAANNQGTYPFSGPGGTGTAPPAGFNSSYDPGDICSTANTYSQTCYDWYSKYVTAANINTTDPSTGSAINIRYSTDTSTPSPPTWSPGDVYIGVGEQCSGASLQSGVQGTGSATSKQFALLMALEISGNWFCIDNR